MEGVRIAFYQTSFCADSAVLDKLALSEMDFVKRKKRVDFL